MDKWSMTKFQASCHIYLKIFQHGSKDIIIISSLKASQGVLPLASHWTKTSTSALFLQFSLAVATDYTVQLRWAILWNPSPPSPSQGLQFLQHKLPGIPEPVPSGHGSKELLSQLASIVKRCMFQVGSQPLVKVSSKCTYGSACEY